MAKKEKQGVRDVFTNATPYNQLEFIIEQKIRQMVNTSALVRIDGCTSTGSSGAAGTVSATPMVAQTDADGNALQMASIPRMPHARVQGGIAALIIDPVAGDLGVASFCKADSSTVGVGASEPQRPGSFRSFDQADGMLVATVSNKAPEVWIELKQDKTIIIHGPEGIILETDKDVTVKAGKNVTVEAGEDVTVTAGGSIVLTSQSSNTITLDCENTVVTGNLMCTGEKGNNVEIAASGTWRGDIHHIGETWHEGNTRQDGWHESTGDQIAGTISQINHVHTGVQTGGGNTGKPK